MNPPVRFPYGAGDPGRSRSSQLAYLPITLIRDSRSVAVSGLLDTGSTVNVLPYGAGLQLGFVWEDQSIPVYLTGSLARVPARAVIVTGVIEAFPAVELAFAWTQTDEVPVILGQTNFFMEFEVCFFRAKLEFEVKPKSP
ncbi:MAG: hypothetical protein NUV77_17700 [Thermoguttaceae bacterium]|jgi:hypothetical protein|nr:hypothetical protein [Thermoguttaceae bacterium]